MSDLRKLIEAVTAGYIHLSDLDPFAQVFGMTDAANDAHMAYRGSFDAARALHEAMLPGWHGSFSTDGFAEVAKGGNVLTVMESCHIDGQPSRAWLVAILRAIEKDAILRAVETETKT